MVTSEDGYLGLSMSSQLAADPGCVLVIWLCPSQSPGANPLCSVTIVNDALPNRRGGTP